MKHLPKPCILRYLTIILIVTLFTTSVQAQLIRERVADKSIKSVQIHKRGWELSYPVIQLNSDDQLTLTFDELSNETNQYNYSVVLLNADNEESTLSPLEYVSGFPHYSVDDYEFSINTTYSYVHYTINFPDDNLKFLRSGNYAIRVYEKYDVDNPIIIKYFKVTEQLVTVSSTMRFPTKIDLRDTHQQLNFSVIHPNLRINNPMSEVKVVVMQNGRQDNIVTNLKPDFIKPSELTYEYQNKLIFEGGNEFRWLDMRSNSFLSEQIQKLIFSEPYYHALLFPDIMRWKEPYLKKGDSNGAYVVSLRDYDEPEIRADYFFTDFSLPMAAPMVNGDIYIIGALTNWQTNQSNKMVYNFNTKAYELTLLLKQGFYNYQYVFVDSKTGQSEMTYLEGNHSITENDYQIFVYYRGPSDYCDRLVGYSLVNTQQALINN